MRSLDNRWMDLYVTYIVNSIRSTPSRRMSYRIFIFFITFLTFSWRPESFLFHRLYINKDKLQYRKIYNNVVINCPDILSVILI